MVLLPACSLQKQEQFQLAQARFSDEEKRRTHRTCCTGNECKSNKVGYQNLDTGHSDIESMMQEVRVHENIAAAVKELRPVPKQCYKKNRCSLPESLPSDETNEQRCKYAKEFLRHAGCGLRFKHHGLLSVKQYQGHDLACKCLR